MIEGFRVKNKVYVLNCNSSLKSLDEFGKEKEGKRINPKDNSAYKEFTHRAYVWDFNSALERNRFIEENKIKIWNRDVAIGNQKYVFEHSDDADDFASSTLTAAEYLGIDKYDPYSKLSKEDQAKLTRRQTNVTGDSFAKKEKTGDVTIETIEGKKNSRGQIRLEDIESIVATVDRPDFFEQVPERNEEGQQINKKD